MIIQKIVTKLIIEALFIRNFCSANVIAFFCFASEFNYSYFEIASNQALFSVYKDSPQVSKLFKKKRVKKKDRHLMTVFHNFEWFGKLFLIINVFFFLDDIKSNA